MSKPLVKEFWTLKDKGRGKLDGYWFVDSLDVRYRNRRAATGGSPPAIPVGSTQPEAVMACRESSPSSASLPVPVSAMRFCR